MEIEKKYLIRNMPENLEHYAKREIEQGYLNRKPVLRIRRSDDSYILTYKAKPDAASDTSDAICNIEIEAPLTGAAYEHLKTKVDNHMISKTRYIIPIGTAADNCPGMDLNAVDEDGRCCTESQLKIELDVFHGCLEGLRFAEVEFPNVDAAQHFYPPAWFGEDVSRDRRYHNGYLSSLDALTDF